MSDKLIMKPEDLGPEDKVRQYFERKSAEIRQRPDTAGRPTDIKLPDPSASLKNYCSRCGTNQAEPFGDLVTASVLRQYGNIIEDYPCGGIQIYTEHEMTIAISRSRGLGTSGQLGYTRVVLTPDK